MSQSGINPNSIVYTDVNQVNKINIEFEVFKLEIDVNNSQFTYGTKTEIKSEFNRLMSNGLIRIVQPGSTSFYYNDIFMTGMRAAETRNATPITDYRVNLDRGNLISVVGTLGECLGYLMQEKIIEWNIANLLDTNMAFEDRPIMVSPDWLYRLPPESSYKYYFGESKATSLRDDENTTNFTRFQELFASGMASNIRAAINFAGKIDDSVIGWSDIFFGAFATIIDKEAIRNLRNADGNQVSELDLGKVFVLFVYPI